MFMPFSFVLPCFSTVGFGNKYYLIISVSNLTILTDDYFKFSNPSIRNLICRFLLEICPLDERKKVVIKVLLQKIYFLYFFSH